jgi:hypothetical protein
MDQVLRNKPKKEENQRDDAKEAANKKVKIIA